MAVKPQPQKQPAVATGQPAQPSPSLANPPEKHNRTAFVREYLKTHPDLRRHVTYKIACRGGLEDLLQG